jgi:DNA anti-recombination protein RmuC
VVYQEFASWLGTIFERLARLPAARGRDFEQTAKDAAVTFQRSARGRLSALEGELRSTRDQAAEIRTQIEQSSADAAAQSNARLDELRQAVDSLDARMQERLEGFESSLETDKEERLRQRREQAEAFEAAEAQRIEAANARQAELEQEWREVKSRGVV